MGCGGCCDDVEAEGDIVRCRAGATTKEDWVLLQIGNDSSGGVREWRGLTARQGRRGFGRDSRLQINAKVTWIKIEHGLGFWAGVMFTV
ncbi:hypothetical protein M0R45_016464 [Rubus argutus]|uniref:Uncharacterized protein n=1 Tax=Rubus argutus TaxID=59490 RepID=A0AAW1XV41_RUBAR